ncbi:MAG: hypothetical protein GXO48_02150 [Chlorobi bacterium]|nr:hypothetical protein [Chlorobiota bacterium]
MRWILVLSVSLLSGWNGMLAQKTLWSKPYNANGRIYDVRLLGWKDKQFYSLIVVGETMKWLIFDSTFQRLRIEDVPHSVNIKWIGWYNNKPTVISITKDDSLKKIFIYAFRNTDMSDTIQLASLNRNVSIKKALTTVSPHYAYWLLALWCSNNQLYVLIIDSNENKWTYEKYQSEPIVDAIIDDFGNWKLLSKEPSLSLIYRTDKWHTEIISHELYDFAILTYDTLFNTMALATDGSIMDIFFLEDSFRKVSVNVPYAGRSTLKPISIVNMTDSGTVIVVEEFSEEWFSSLEMDLYYPYSIRQAKYHILGPIGIYKWAKDSLTGKPEWIKWISKYQRTESLSDPFMGTFLSVSPTSLLLLFNDLSTSIARFTATVVFPLGQIKQRWIANYPVWVSRAKLIGDQTVAVPFVERKTLRLIIIKGE